MHYCKTNGFDKHICDRYAHLIRKNNEIIPSSMFSTEIYHRRNNDGARKNDRARHIRWWFHLLRIVSSKIQKDVGKLDPFSSENMKKIHGIADLLGTV